ncbi:MAG: HAMP domain-containing sensor histidine kinase [Candidatus Devosia phytovorans]|uniref:histidine kinase n=1 Tax=Candidatus Devosia phytovorans TaxID=3121372 RepID=A0AAJ5VYX4_9HYPH|nr:HAMP domain-containing sensor histidine kinase [Devosia sp.]WEK06571.1 MAG: HAMP domain-containing sensor histidine kinase [Devosia sp.]
MALQVPIKWRPSMALVVYGVLLAVLGLPSGLIVMVRLFGGRGLSTLEIGVLLTSLIGTLTIAYVLTRAVTRPIEALVTRTHQIALGGRSAIRPPDAYGTAELASLSQAFLDLASRLMDRTEYMRSFAAHVSHELKSPLTAIRGSAELMRDEGDSMTPAERQKFLDNIVRDTDRLTRLVARLRELAQAEMPMGAGTTTLADALPELRAQWGQLDIVASGEDVVLPLPKETLGIVLAHLADNSSQHGATRITLDATGDTLTISDNGSGISEGNREKIFQPFFTTRRDSGGTGMGLDIVRALLRAHGADIVLEPSPQGAVFRIFVNGAGAAG